MVRETDYITYDIIVNLISLRFSVNKTSLFGVFLFRLVHLIRSVTFGFWQISNNL